MRVDRSYDVNEFDQIAMGQIPVVMEDHWFIYYEKPWLHLHRSWTGLCVFEVRFERVMDRYDVVEALVNRDPEQYRSENDQNDALLLCILMDGLAGRPTEALWKQYLAAVSAPQNAACVEKRGLWLSLWNWLRRECRSL